LNISINKSFAKDTEAISDKKILYQIADVIDSIKNIDKLSEIENCKKLKGSKNAFRIKLGHYRIGLIFEKEILELVRVLHRKDIYNSFPK
jgi:mRNA interferase RelE/StbE